MLEITLSGSCSVEDMASCLRRNLPDEPSDVTLTVAVYGRKRLTKAECQGLHNLLWPQLNHSKCHSLTVKTTTHYDASRIILHVRPVE